jgi:WD40 repeat protein
VRLFDSRTGALVNTFADYGEGVAFAPDGRTLAVVSWRSLSLIDLATGLCISRFDMGLEQDALRNVFFSEDGKHVASIGSNGVMIFDTLTASPHIIATDKCLFTDAENIENAFRVSRLPNSLDQVGPPDEAAYVAEFWRHTLPGFRPNNSSDGGMGIQRIAFSPDGKLAAIHTFGGITILDVSNGETVWFLASPDQKYLRTTAFSPDGKLLAATGDHQTIFVWSAETGKDVRRIGHPPPAITSVSFGERCILDVSRCRRFGDSFERRARLTAFAIGSFEGFSPLGATRVSASGFGL